MRICTHCGGSSQVLETRATVSTIRRRRKCLQCGERWWTHEVSEGAYMVSPEMQQRIDGAKAALASIESDLAHIHERLRS